MNQCSIEIAIFRLPSHLLSRTLRNKTSHVHVSERDPVPYHLKECPEMHFTWTPMGSPWLFRPRGQVVTGISIKLNRLRQAVFSNLQQISMWKWAGLGNVGYKNTPSSPSSSCWKRKNIQSTRTVCISILRFRCLGLSQIR